MQKIGNVAVRGEKLDIFRGQYASGAPVIQLKDGDGLPYATISVNVPNVALQPGEMTVKVYSENEPLRTPMLATGLFTDTGGRVDIGHAQAEIWRMTA